MTLDDIVDDRPAWWRHAACNGVDPDLFFPEIGGNATYAQKICATCVARPACLQYAIDNGEKYGVWGGTTARERRLMRGLTS